MLEGNVKNNCDIEPEVNTWWLVPFVVMYIGFFMYVAVQMLQLK